MSGEGKNREAQGRKEEKVAQVLDKREVRTQHLEVVRVECVCVCVSRTSPAASQQMAVISKFRFSASRQRVSSSVGSVEATTIKPFTRLPQNDDNFSTIRTRNVLSPSISPLASIKPFNQHLPLRWRQKKSQSAQWVINTDGENSQGQKALIPRTGCGQDSAAADGRQKATAGN